MKKLSLVIGFIVFACTIQAQEIGVQLYTFREQFKKDVKGTIEMIHKMGIKEIEGGGTYGMDKNEYKKLLDVNELKMVSVGADFGQLLKTHRPLLMRLNSLGQLMLCVHGYLTMEHLPLMMLRKQWKF
jgi:hypothetical protein